MAGPIFLIGFPGCGKTTLGRALASAGAARFLDLDDEIERRAAMSVTEIFRRLGESRFRQLEADTLADICRHSDDGAQQLVVACGGGTPCRPGAMEAMKAAGTVVWLKASRQRLLQRLIEGRHKRPKIADLDDGAIARYLDDTGRERSHHYSLADRCFDSSLLDTPAEIDLTVADFINQFNLQQ